MTQKKDSTHPITAKGLAEKDLFKISAEIDIDLYREFKSLCAEKGLKMKEQIQDAVQLKVNALKYGK